MDPKASWPSFRSASALTWRRVAVGWVEEKHAVDELGGPGVLFFLEGQAGLLDDLGLAPHEGDEPLGLVAGELEDGGGVAVEPAHLEQEGGRGKPGGLAVGLGVVAGAARCLGW